MGLFGWGKLIKRPRNKCVEGFCVSCRRVSQDESQSMADAATIVWTTFRRFDRGSWSTNSQPIRNCPKCEVSSSSEESDADQRVVRPCRRGQRKPRKSWEEKWNIFSRMFGWSRTSTRMKKFIYFHLQLQTCARGVFLSDGLPVVFFLSLLAA